MNNLRAAASWIATPVGLVALYLLADWFFSTEPAVLAGLTLGLLVLLGMALLVASFFYVFRK